MKNKGFTLIELLAVILILGIIALIAIPTVNSVIEQSRKGATESSGTNIIKAIETNCNMQLLNREEISSLYVFNEDGIYPNVDIKGNLPKEGYAKVNDKCEVLLFANDGNYAVFKDYEDDKVETVNKRDNVVMPLEYKNSNKIEIYNVGKVVDSVEEGNPAADYIINNSFWNETSMGYLYSYVGGSIVDVSMIVIRENVYDFGVEKIGTELNNYLKFEIEEVYNECLKSSSQSECTEQRNEMRKLKLSYFIYDDTIFAKFVGFDLPEERMNMLTSSTFLDSIKEYKYLTIEK